MTDKNQPLIQYLAFAWELGYSIALPLVGSAFGGRWLDARFGTTPALLLIGITISIIISTVIIVRKTSRLLHDAEKNNQQKTPPHDQPP